MLIQNMALLSGSSVDFKAFGALTGVHKVASSGSAEGGGRAVTDG